MSWREAHFRLLEILPKRTHVSSGPIEVSVVRKRTGGKKAKQPVTIKGVRYHSLTAAAAALGTHRAEIWQMVYRGEARFG